MRSWMYQRRRFFSTGGTSVLRSFARERLITFCSICRVVAPVNSQTPLVKVEKCDSRHAVGKGRVRTPGFVCSCPGPPAHSSTFLSPTVPCAVTFHMIVVPCRTASSLLPGERGKACVLLEMSEIFGLRSSILRRRSEGGRVLCCWPQQGVSRVCCRFGPYADSCCEHKQSRKKRSFFSLFFPCVRPLACPSCVSVLPCQFFILRMIQFDSMLLMLLCPVRSVVCYALSPLFGLFGRS